MSSLPPRSGSAQGSPDFFRNLANHASVMIWMSGLDMGCFYFNQAWLDFRGRTLAEEFGNGWAEGVHPDDLKGCIHHYVSSFEQRQPFAMSYRLRNARHEYRWILDRGAPHFLPDGTFLGFFGGCAETEAGTVVAHNAELGVQLAEMREAARQVAAEAGTLFTRGSGGLDASAPGFQHELPDAHLEGLRRKHRAARELEQLATDMIRHQDIANGAHLKT